jgi:ribosomal protein L35
MGATLLLNNVNKAHFITERIPNEYRQLRNQSMLSACLSDHLYGFNVLS